MSKENRDFGNQIKKAIIESALIAGKIKASDFLDRKTLVEKLKKFIPKNDKDFHVIINHQSSLLKEALRYNNEKNYKLAKVFYATYFEHSINEILDIWGRKNLIRHEVVISLIRRASLEDKYTWVLEILKLPTFNKNHWRIIKKISDQRNNFIHYKYKSEQLGEPMSKAESKEWEIRDKNSVLKAISYTKLYRSRVVFTGKKKIFNS